MRGVKGRKPWFYWTLAVGLLIFAGVQSFDYMTNQLMAQASPGVVKMLEPEGTAELERIPEKAAAERAAAPEGEGMVMETAQGPSANALERESEHAGLSQAASSSSKSTTTVKVQAPVQNEGSAATEKADPDGEAESVTVDAEAASLSEKAKAYKLAASKLSAGEINSLIQWSQGGFTQDEKEKAKALFYSRFTAEEQQWILGLFRKYGQ